MISLLKTILRKSLRALLEFLEQDERLEPPDELQSHKSINRLEIEQQIMASKTVDLRQKDLSDLDLSGLDLKEANFSGANLSRAKFVGANLEGADLRDSICLETNFLDAALRNTLFYKANLRGARFSPYSFRTYSGARLRTKWEIGDVRLADLSGNIEDYHKAREACLSIAHTLYEQGNFSDASVFRVAAMRANRTTRNPFKRYKRHRALGRGHFISLTGFVRNLIRWLGLIIPDALCVYGESVWRVVIWIIFILFGFGPLLLFISGGLDWSNASEQTQILLQIDHPVVQSAYFYFQYLMYVFDSFTTTDFSVLEPRNDLVRFISGMLAFIGIFFAGLLGFVAGNRIRNM
ncbi:MAG: pentapeptide repeat-containing protein [Ardenticatenaceae bacterium]|nr:pentapeptide repeat-containing protein [Ardenticatenaceae bacterium]